MGSKGCPLTKSKIESASINICLNCPFPTCSKETGISYILKPCSYCGGKLEFRPEDAEWVCINCSRSQEPDVIEVTRPRAKSELPECADLIPSSLSTEHDKGVTESVIQSKAESGPAPPVKARHTFLDFFKKDKVKESAQPEPPRVTRPVEAPKHRFFYNIPFSTFSSDGAWYEPASLRLSQSQNIFLIKNLGMLSEGQYPPEPGEYKTEILDKETKKHIEVTKTRSTYIKHGKGQINKRAQFETPAMITAEITSRLRRCGLDGMILLLLCSFDSEDKQWIGREIANFIKVEVRTVNKRAEKALRYISGKWPKDTSYEQFKKH